MGQKLEVKPGDRYGRWTVICEVPELHSPTNGRAYRMVNCQCDCGTVGNRTLESLRQKNSMSCGCLQNEARRRTGANNRTHGFTGTSTYWSWIMMKDRCYCEADRAFHRYGARGIIVCDRWLNDFEAFLADMGMCPDGCSIDRINNDGNYEPTNCRWATKTEQARNRSSNVMLTFGGETMCISAWAERFEIPRKTLEKRLSKYGFTVEEALTRPVRRKQTQS